MHVKSVQRSIMGKKIWLSMHPGNFGNDVTVRMPVRITGITHSTGNVM